MSTDVKEMRRNRAQLLDFLKRNPDAWVKVHAAYGELQRVVREYGDAGLLAASLLIFDFGIELNKDN